MLEACKKTDGCSKMCPIGQKHRGPCMHVRLLSFIALLTALKDVSAANDGGHTAQDRPSLDALGWALGTDKASHHSYTLMYEPFIAQWRDVSIRLLEIGVLNGSSLLMWNNYFSHPRAEFIGAGLHDPITKSLGRARVIKADQSRETDLAKLKELGPWTIVVDDGSHVPHHQLMTFQQLFPTVVPGGLYIIEDIEVNYWRKRGAIIYGNPINGKVNMVEMFRRAIDSIINSEFTCPVVKSPIFSSEIDRMISAVTFIRNAIIVRKMPEQFIRHVRYRMVDKIPCLAQG